MCFCYLQGWRMPATTANGRRGRIYYGTQARTRAFLALRCTAVRCLFLQLLLSSPSSPPTHPPVVCRPSAGGCEAAHLCALLQRHQALPRGLQKVHRAPVQVGGETVVFVLDFSLSFFRAGVRWGGAGRRDSPAEGSASCIVWARRSRLAATVGCCTCGREVSGWGGLSRHMLPLLTAAGRMSASLAPHCASSGAASKAGWS